MSAHQLVFDMVLSKTAAWLLSAAKLKWRSGALHRSILQQHSNATHPKTMCESGSAVLLRTHLLSFFVLTVDCVFHHKKKKFRHVKPQLKSRELERIHFTFMILSTIFKLA